MDKRKKSSPENGKRGGHPKIFNEEKRNYAKKLYLEGESVSSIAERTGISIQHLYRLKNDWQIRSLKVALVHTENFEQGMSLSDRYDLEVLRAICKINNITPKIMRRSFGELLKLSASGQVDLAISNFSPTEERKKANQFSGMYSNEVRGDIAFFVNKKSAFYHLNQVYKGKFGVLKNSLHEFFLNKQKALQVKKFIKDEDLFKNLLLGNIDCVLSDRGGIKKEFLADTREIPSPWKLNYGMRPAIAYHRNEDRLGFEIDSTIEKMRSRGLFDLFLEKVNCENESRAKLDKEIEQNLENIKNF